MGFIAEFIGGAILLVVIIWGIWCLVILAIAGLGGSRDDPQGTNCRRCGKRVNPSFRSARGVSSYNCECGNSWTIRW